MGRFFWLKLKKDFFKRHDIRIIQKMPDGEKMVLFYLKLLCESVDHDGKLRFSEEVPYDNEMLASVTDTDPKIVEETMKILKKLGMMKVDKKQTIIMCGAESMLGSETQWAEKKRQYRDTKRTEEGQSEDNVLEMSGQKKTMSDKSKSKSKSKRKSKSIEKEIDIEESEDNKLFSLSSKDEREFPSKDEVMKFAHSHKIDRVIDVNEWFDFYQEQEWKIKGEPIQDWKALLMKWASGIKDKKNVRYMENEYSEEHLKEKEEESLQALDELLQE